MVYKTFGVVMVAMQVTLLWIVYVANFEDRASAASTHLRLRRGSDGALHATPRTHGEILAGLAFTTSIALAGIAFGTFMIVGCGGGSELVLYDDAVEQVWRFGRRRLQKDEIAYKMALTYKVPYVVLIPRDKKRKKMTITPCEYVRDDAFKAWMDSIPSGLNGRLFRDSSQNG